MLDQAIARGARWIRARVDEITRVDGGVQIKLRAGSQQCYDLLAVSPGVNTRALRLFPPLAPNFQPPKIVQTFVREYLLGKEVIERYLGHHTIHGISQKDFEGHYWSMCRNMERDNRAGKLIFTLVRFLKPQRFAMRGVVRMVKAEHQKQSGQRRMGNIMWDMFTGSAPYREILIRFFHPAFWSRFLWYVGSSLIWRT